MNWDFFKRWIKRNEKNEKYLRGLVIDVCKKRGIKVPIKNVEVRIAVHKNNVPLLIGSGGCVSQGIKKDLGCDFVKIVSPPEMGKMLDEIEKKNLEYRGFYRERRSKEHQKWTEEEENKLISLRNKRLSVSEIAEKLRRTPFAIKKRTEKLENEGSGDDPSPFPTFSRTEDFLISKYWKKDRMDVSKIAKLTGRTKKEVVERMKELGIVQKSGKIKNQKKKTDPSSAYLRIGKKLKEKNSDGEFIVFNQ